jgi:hypothetical protein
MNGDESIDRPLRDFGLWIGIIGPPSFWLIQFQTIYMLVYPACGAGRNLTIGFTCGIFFLVIVGLGLYPLRNYSVNRHPENPVSRTRRFMSILGLMSTALFLLLVIAQWIAALLVDPCVI